MLGPWLRKPLYAVGPATAALAKTLGFLNVIGESSGYASSLSSLIIQQYQESRDTKHPLLFLCGNQRRPVLPEALTEAGVPFTEIKVYDSRPISTASAEFTSTLSAMSQVALTTTKTPPWIVLFSPSGFSVIQCALDTMRSKETVPLPRIATIGATTSAKVIESGYTVAAQASEPTAESLLGAIRDHSQL